MDNENHLKLHRLNKSVKVKSSSKSFFLLSKLIRNEVQIFGIYYEASKQSNIVMSIKDGVDNRRILTVNVIEDVDDKWELVQLDAEFGKSEFNMTNFKESCYIYDITMESLTTKFKKIFLKDEDIKYMVLVNPEATIGNVKSKIFKTYVRSFYLNGVVVDEKLRFMDYKGVNFGLYETVTLMNLSERYPKLTIAFNPSTLIQKVSKETKHDSDGIRLYDQNKIIIHDPAQIIKGEAMFKYQPYIYYEISNIKLRCTSFNDVDEYYELTVPLECRAYELITRLQKKLHINIKNILLFQNNTWLQGDSIVSPSQEVRYHIASLITELASMVPIAQGGFGIVYQCRPKMDKEYIALKKLSSAAGDHAVTNIIREFTLMSQLSLHPNIVRFIDLYTDQSSIYIAMEYMADGSLQQYLKMEGAQREDFVKRISRCLMSGLAHLHNNNILHRDIKSANVLLKNNYMIAKLSDFGISKILPRLNESEMVHTVKCGTQRWMAPEVISGRVYDMKADVWSMGATVIEMITGKVPHFGITNEALILVIASMTTIKYEPVHPMSPSFVKFLDMCLEPESHKRHSSCELLKVPFLQL